MQREKNETLNALKGIACILVVFIHIRFPGTFGQGVVALARPAVAIFFLISGYYLYRPENSDMLKALPKKIFRTLRLTLFASMVYLLWESFVRFVGTGISSTLSYLKSIFTFRQLLITVFLSHDPVVGDLWFLWALFEAYCVLWLLLKLKCKLSWIPTIIVLELHIIGFAVALLYGYDIDIVYTRNVWLYALPCMILGVSLHRNQDRGLSSVSNRLLIVGLTAGIVLTLAERYLVGYLQLYNGSLLIVFNSFLLALRYPQRMKDSFISLIGEKYSTDVYIYHWMVGEVLTKLQEIFNISVVLSNWIFPFLAIAITLSGLMLVYKIKESFNRKRKMK